jgi:hypothetical protein
MTLRPLGCYAVSSLLPQGSAEVYAAAFALLVGSPAFVTRQNLLQTLSRNIQITKCPSA